VKGRRWEEGGEKGKAWPGEKVGGRWEKVGGSRGEAARKGVVSGRALPHPPHVTLEGGPPGLLAELQGVVPAGRPGLSKTTHSPLVLGGMGGGALTGVMYPSIFGSKMPMNILVLINFCNPSLDCKSVKMANVSLLLTKNGT